MRSLVDHECSRGDIDFVRAEIEKHIHLPVCHLSGREPALARHEAEVQAADSTYDFRAALKEVHANRATNYVLVVNVLRKAERLLATAPAGSTAATALTAVVTEGLTVDDDTDKAALRDLRKDLEGAKGLLAPSTGD